MLRLVGLRYVLPDIIGAIDIAGTNFAGFFRSAIRNSLEANHVGHDVGKVGQCDVHNIIGNGLNWLRFPSFGYAIAEFIHRQERMVKIDTGINSC